MSHYDSQHASKPQHRKNAVKRMYGLSIAMLLIGMSMGLLLAPAVTLRGLLAFSLLGFGLIIEIVAVTLWRDPL